MMLKNVLLMLGPYKSSLCVLNTFPRMFVAFFSLKVCLDKR